MKRRANIEIDGCDEKIQGVVSIKENGLVIIRKDSGKEIITHISKCIIELIG